DVLLFVEWTTAARGNPRPASSAPIMVRDSNKEPTNLALMGSNAIPEGWRATSYSHYQYLASVEDEASPRRGRAVRIARPRSALPGGAGARTKAFPAAPWHGRRLVFSAALRADAARIGTGAQLLIHVWPKRPEGPDATITMPMMALQPD